MNILKFMTKCVLFVNRMQNNVRFMVHGIQVGRHFVVHGKIGITKEHNSQITIGNNFYCISGKHINPLCGNKEGTLCAEENAIIKIGDNCGFSSPQIWAHKIIKIGNNVDLGAGVVIFDSDCHSIDWHHRMVPSLDKENKIDKPIIIEDNVLIGANSIVLKGVTIGARSVIGAGSVVTKDIPEDCIAGGNPAKVIRVIQ